MKLLITGARGDFPLALIPRLLPEHALVLYDIEPMGAPEGCVSIQADIRDGAALVHAMRGCDAVIHAAAYRGSTRDFHNDEDFYSVNVTGTHNVLRAMHLNQVPALVFASTDDVYGDGMKGRRVMDESVPCIPTRTYALTKALGEEMCRFYARRHDFRVAILRFGVFNPTDWKQEGLGRLNRRLEREDVAQATELALAAVASEEVSCEEFLIECAKPFHDDDWPALALDPEPVIEKYYPGSIELLAAHGLRVPPVFVRHDITKAVEMLGYDPQHNFEQFLARLGRGEREEPGFSEL